MLSKKHLSGTQKEKNKKNKVLLCFINYIYIYCKVIFIICTIFNNFDIKDS